MPSSLSTFSRKAKLPTATASDHRASRTDNSSRKGISTNLAWSEPTRREKISTSWGVSVTSRPALIYSSCLEFLFQTFRQPYPGKSCRVRCALARKLAQHGLHGRRQTHIKLGGIVLKNRFSKHFV